eukprot:scaffold166127_cov15-Tisochrysis_lutea.AAC.1
MGLPWHTVGAYIHGLLWCVFSWTYLAFCRYSFSWAYTPACCKFKTHSWHSLHVNMLRPQLLGTYHEFGQ